MEETCPFCRILAGSARAEFVYEDEWTMVIKDVAPQAPVHLLVISRLHIPSASHVMSPEVWSHLMDAAVVVARSLKLEQSGYRLVVNCGRDGGQTIPHLHVHLLAGRRFAWPPG